MKVKVYRNLHRKCWSIMDPKTRRVIDRKTSLSLSNVSLIVGESGRERVIREKAKNVHAYAIGEISKNACSEQGMVEVTYNPYVAGYFFEVGSKKVRNYADKANLSSDGKLFLSKE